MKQLVSFYWGCGRIGHVEGLFVCEKEELEKAIGKQVYLGEVLGKHSEIYGALEREDVTILSENQEKIEWLLSVCGNNDTISGYNPLYYLREEYEEDEEETDEDII